MAEPISIKITNLPQIRAAFDKAPALMAKELNLAIKKTLLVVQRKSMINTPVLTGRLRASTYSRMGFLKGEVGTNTNYDIFVHDGTRFMPARPYLADAVEDSNPEVDLLFLKAVDNVLSEIGRAT